jgi:FixJ family two-component response regulator
VALSGIALIAVIDDDEAVCEAMSSLVRSAGYLSATFTSAETFLESICEHDIDCILLDIRMGRMSGLDLHLAMRRTNWNVPVIFVTATNDRVVREQALFQGATAFLLKPVNDDALLTAICTALQGRLRTNIN